MLTLYLRREPTTDKVTLDHNAAANRFDVVAYRDEACGTVAARWPWYYSSKPRRNARACFRWNAIWKENTE
jgi:hypothetical protein